ncbi:undecaprenyldiphospho-muramoylpentapeptide beta-N-acetylglucosaminyltransferase [Alteromonas sp. CYL-A6]|uniref:undecaprenyldiphospho-muramoylpentapeptide beta-N-acetylglucosaminyltransferase n=1 Tax=Alteromonas nitratireducens TaxID=3390813 RepID=UPI0034C24412
MTKRCLIMAGGTGGHVFPGLAVADALRAKGWHIDWLGTADRMEAHVVPDAGYPIHFIPVSGLRGKSGMARLKGVFGLLKSLIAARRLVKEIRPDVVIGMGGYASGPGGVAAWLAGIPLIIHEQNAVAGLTNRLLAKFARRILLGFADAKAQFGETNPKVEVVGNPVRNAVMQLSPKAQCEKPLKMLVVGGSLGARPLNEIVPGVCSQMEGLEVRHQCGKGNLEAVRAAYAGARFDVHVDEFIDNMAAAYAWADFVVCRAGALTVAEVAAAGRAAIFVPLPHAVDDHQTKNAMSLVNKQAALLIAQPVLNENLGQAIRQWLQDPQACAKMGRLAKDAMQEHATEHVVNQCEALTGAGD